MQPWAGHEVLLSELGSREEPPGEGAVLWVAVTVIHTHRFSPQEAEVQDTLPSSVCLSGVLNSAVPVRVPQKSTAEGRTTLGYFSQAGNTLLKFG